MEPQEDQPHTLCPKCNNFILTPNFLIHEARCKGNNRQSSTYMRNSRISGVRTSDNERNSNVNGEQERIPCPFCGYGQTLAELDTHPAVCPHREVSCNLCHLKFPLSLMEQHELVCTSRQRSMPSRQQQENQNTQQQQANRNQQQRVEPNPYPNLDSYSNRNGEPQPERTRPSYSHNDNYNPNFYNNNRNRIIEEAE